MNKMLLITFLSIFHISFGQTYSLKQVVGNSNLPLPTLTVGKPTAFNDDYMFIGANEGPVQVYEFTEEKWTFLQEISEFDERGFGRFIDIKNEVLVIGNTSTGEDRNEGTVFFYELQSGLWERVDTVQTNLPLGTNSSPFWGAGLSLGDGFVSVGRNNGNSRFIHVVSEISEGDWEITDTLNTPDFISSTFTAASDNELIVSGQFFFGINRLYSFERNENGVWDEDPESINVPSDVSVSSLGFDISLLGDYLLVGSPEDRINDLDEAGSVVLFENIGGTWTFVEQFVSDNPTEGARFGHSVALSENEFIIGSPGTEQAYLYTKEGVNTWNNTQIITQELDEEDERDRFGFNVDFTRDQVVIFDLQNAYVYDTDAVDCNGENAGGAIIDICCRCSGGNTGEEIELNSNDCLITSVSDFSEEESSTVFPNPAFNTITIKGKKGDKVTLLNSLGNRLFESDMTGDQMEISLDSYQGGNYFIEVKNNNRINTTEFIHIK